MSYLKMSGTIVIYVGLFLAVITFIPGLPPDVELREHSVALPRDLDPRIGPKNRLNGGEKLFDGEITGPESFHTYNGQLYTGIHGGYIVRVEEDRLVPIVKFGKKCDGIWQEHICGRPLGLRFDKEGNLFVADCYYGIFKVNVTTADYVNIVDSSELINGKSSKLPNSLAVAENGDIYWTDSSLDFQLYNLVLLFLDNPSGRFLRYNAATKKNEILIENLGFANGVQLSDDESFVLVSETLLCRIVKYHLKGPKAGQHEIFIDRLPGMPDNIQEDGHGGFLITMIISIDSEHPELSLSLIPHPYIRKMLIRLLTLLKAPFDLLNDFIPNVYAQRISHAIVSYQGLGLLFDQERKSLVLRLDASGNILEALSSDDDTIKSISEAYIYNDYLWLGSPWRKHIIRVPLKQAFPDLVDNEKLSSHTKSKKQSTNAADSNINSERMKRDTDSVTTKPIESKPIEKKAPSPMPKSTAAPTTTAKPIPTPKPTAAPTPKTSDVPNPSSAPKASKSTTTDNDSEKSSKTKPASKPVNAEIKNSAKSNSPNVKHEKNSKGEENSVKTTTTKSEKNVKVEQDTPVKQKISKSESEKVKPTEINPSKDS